MSHSKFMMAAINAAAKAPITNKAFSVGAVVVLDGEIVCTGYSRELTDSVHAEEVCIEKLSKMNLDHSKLVMYTTMEPCGERLSGKKSCSDLIIEAKIPLVFVGCLEPNLFIKTTQGINKLKTNNVNVKMIPELQGISIKIIVRKVHRA